MNAAVATTGSPRRFTDATRVLTSVLAPAERRTLAWLSRHMPDRVNSDHLTALALLAMAGAGLSYWLASVTPIGLWLVVLCLALNWFGDSLDGTLARVRQQQRPRYGFYVDHVVDALGATFLLAGLGVSGYMSALVAAVLLVSYLLLCVEAFLATHTLGAFTMSHFKVGPTELRILLAFGTLVLLVHPTASILGHEFRLFDVGGVVASACLFATLVVVAIGNTRTLYWAEPVPRRSHV